MPISDEVKSSKSSKHCFRDPNTDVQLRTDLFQSQLKPGAEGTLEATENQRDKKKFNRKSRYVVNNANNIVLQTICSEVHVISSSCRLSAKTPHKAV
jgi:hypothetical protein